MIITIFLRKRIFLCIPKVYIIYNIIIIKNLKKYFAMDEISFACKARNGGTLENMFWIVMLCLCIYEKRILIYGLRETVLIRK